MEEIFGFVLMFHAHHHFTVVFMSSLKFVAPFSVNHLHYPLSHLAHNQFYIHLLSAEKSLSCEEEGDFPAPTLAQASD